MTSEIESRLENEIASVVPPAMHAAVRGRGEEVPVKSSLEMLQEASRRRRLALIATGVSNLSLAPDCGTSEKVADRGILPVCAIKNSMPSEDGNANG